MKDGEFNKSTKILRICGICLENLWEKIKKQIEGSNKMKKQIFCLKKKHQKNPIFRFSDFPPTKRDNLNSSQIIYDY